MKNIAIGCFCMFTTLSCCKAIFNDVTVIKNNTSHSISINHYKNGNITQSFNVGSFSKVEGGGLGLPIDSTSLKWDDSREVVYYVYIKPDPNRNVKIYQPDNARSLFNSAAFEQKVEHLKCDGTNTTRTYTFIEQDYLDAKK